MIICLRVTSSFLRECLPGCVLITLNGARTPRLGDHNWFFKQPFFVSQNFCSLSLKTSTLPADTTSSSSVFQRLTTLCEKKNFLVSVRNLLLLNLTLVLPEVSSSKKIPTIWQTVLLIFWTSLSGQPGYVFLPGSSTPISPTSPHSPTLSTPAPYDWTFVELSPTTPHP